MAAKKQSSVVLVYDRYYGKKPGALIQTLKKTAYCCALSICAVLFLAAEYNMPVNPWAAAGFTALFCGLFSAAFFFVKKRFAIPAALLVGGFIVWHEWETLSVKLSFFADKFLLALNGAVFYTEDWLFHPAEIFELFDGKSSAYGLSPSVAELYADYSGGVLLGTVIVSFIFSMITSACMFRKPNIWGSFGTLAALCVPMVTALNFVFNFWAIPTLALYIGAAALTISYAEGAAVKKGFIGSFRSDAKKEEREFRNKAAKVDYLKRASMNGVYYSKYLSAALYAAAVFAAGGLIANSLPFAEKGLDFSGFFSLLNSIGQSSGMTSPFESGPVSEYFTNVGGSGGSVSSLSIISPGNGNRETLRVSSSDSPVYLRGDIGINFNGRSWTTLVTTNNTLWINLRRDYLPAEMRILQSFETMEYSEENVVLTGSDVTIDYLHPTDIVVLPAYTTEFGYFQDPQFDVYGDFAVRVDKDYDKVNTVKCRSLVPRCTYTGVEDSAECAQKFAELLTLGENYSFERVYNSYIGRDIYDEYEKYVYATYLNVPDSLDRRLKEFLTENGLYRDVSENGGVDPGAAYQAAMDLTDFLMNNYTYSLNAPNSRGNLIMSFLNDTKSGHCALYATSMTLMMREMGVPARYCTGFVAPITGEDSVILREKNLHAWCEVFFDGVGWITFDPTSASATNLLRPDEDDPESSSVSRPESSITDEDWDKNWSEEDEDPDDESSAVSDASSDTEHESLPQSEEQNVNILPYVLIIICAAAIAAAAVFLLTRIKAFDRNAKKMLKKLYKSRSTERVYLKILRVLALCGITPAAGELPEEMFGRAQKQLGVDFETNRELLMKTAFGEAEGEEETARLARLLENLFFAADKKLKGTGRLKLRKIILSGRSGKAEKK